MRYSSHYASTNRTYISLSDGDELVDTEKMKLLKKYNTDQITSRNIVNKQKLGEEDVYLTLDSIASTLKLTSGQKERAHRIIENVESKKRGIRAVSFAVCVIVANQDVEGKRYWVEKNDNDPRFESFVEEHDIDPLPAINQVKEELDYV